MVTLFVCLFVYLFICFVCLFVCLFICLFCLFICFCLVVCLSVYLFVYLFLFVYLSVFVCLFVGFCLFGFCFCCFVFVCLFVFVCFVLFVYLVFVSLFICFCLVICFVCLFVCLSLPPPLACLFVCLSAYQSVTYPVERHCPKISDRKHPEAWLLSLRSDNEWQYDSIWHRAVRITGACYHVRRQNEHEVSWLLHILRYLFDDVLTTQHSMNVERQIAVTSLLTLQQKPDTADVGKEHTVSFFRRNLLSLWGRQIVSASVIMQTVHKLEAFVIMGQNWVINIVTPCAGCCQLVCSVISGDVQ